MNTLAGWLHPLLDTIPLQAWLAVAAALVLQRLTARAGMWPYALFALPGTLAHELSHYLVGHLMFAQPRFPSVWPQRTPQGWRLGAVAFTAPWWRAAPVALAPFALLPLALWWMGALLAPATGALFALHAWLAATLLNASMPSRTDLRVALPVLGVLAAALALWLLLR